MPQDIQAFLSELLTPSDAGKILGVSAHRVRQFSNEGRIPCYRTVSGVRLFWKGDIEDFKETRDALREAKQTNAG